MMLIVIKPQNKQKPYYPRYPYFDSLHLPMIIHPLVIGDLMN